jgi:hypothetical protein
LKRVGQSVVKYITTVGGDDLCDLSQSSQRGRIQQTITVSLGRRAIVSLDLGLPFV